MIEIMVDRFYDYQTEHNGCLKEREPRLVRIVRNTKQGKATECTISLISVETFNALTQLI